ncbi:MAG: hypothetical protein ACN6O3_10585 [Comamonas sp.]
MNQAPLPQPRQDALRAQLPQVADLLQQRRASEIDETVIDDLVSLAWLEWVGGSLQLTTTGTNICRRRQME